ncbi:MAG: hypothetical protein AAB225_23860 [Acidobacteriota bacterium]
MELFASSQIEKLANKYLMDLAGARALSGPELAEAEIAFVLSDWDGLALLSYQQYLEQGRGALIGPRTTTCDDLVTIAFDYTPQADAEVARIAGQRPATSLRTQIEHYHPELDFIVVWLRPDGTVRWEVLRSRPGAALRPPHDLYLRMDEWRRPRPN